MRTVFVSTDTNRIRAVKQQLDQLVENTRLQDGEGTDDWTIVGEPNQVQDKIALYQERLGMTHMIATRLRIGGMDEAVLRESVSLLAELVAAR